MKNLQQWGGWQKVLFLCKAHAKATAVVETNGRNFCCLVPGTAVSARSRTEVWRGAESGSTLPLKNRRICCDAVYWHLTAVLPSHSVISGHRRRSGQLKCSLWDTLEVCSNLWYMTIYDNICCAAHGHLRLLRQLETRERGKQS